GRGGVVAGGEEFEAARRGVEDRELGESTAGFARGIHRTGVDEVALFWIEPKLGSGKGEVAQLFAVELVDLPLVAVAEEADPRGRELGSQVARLFVGQHDVAVDHALSRQRAQPRRARRPQLAARALERVDRLVRAAREAELPGAD